MSKDIYAWAPGRGGGSVNVTGVNPQAVGEELASIKAVNGVLTAPLVIDSAKAESSPLHDVFEWDDDVAADQYRLNQARALIKMVYVKVVPDKPPVPIYINITTQTEDDKRVRCYEDIRVVMKDANQRQTTLHKAWKDLERWREKYEALSELAEVFEAMDNVAPKVEIKA